MGLFSTSSKNTTNAYDQSESTTYNTSLAGGDSDVSDSIVATHSNLSTVDNSLALSMADNSYNDSSTRTSSTDNRDSSNNSFNLNTSGSDYSQQSTTNITSTDGGSFSMVSNVMGKMIDSLTGNQNKLIDLVGLSQNSTLSASNNLVSRSMDSAKSVEAVAVQSNQQYKLIAGGLALSAAVFAMFKFARGRK